MNIQNLRNVTNHLLKGLRKAVTYLVKFFHLEQSGGRNRMDDNRFPLALLVWDSCFDPDDPLRSSTKYLVRFHSGILDNFDLPATYACGSAWDECPR